MSTAHLLSPLRFLARVEARPAPRAPSLLQRLLGRLVRRQPRLPRLSDHLYRDIGLEPPPRDGEEFWLLFGRP